MRTKPCDASIRRGRLRKANQFLDASDQVRDLTSDVRDVADACITLYVNSGIAAADVICCARLGEHAQGDNHAEAIALLKSAAPGAARHLGVLLGLKTKSAYSHEPAAERDVTRAGRAAAALIEQARRASA